MTGRKTLIAFFLLKFLCQGTVCQRSAASPLVQGTIQTVSLELDQRLLKDSNIPVDWYGSIENSCDVGVYVPKASPGRQRSDLLLVYGPGGANLRSLPAYQRYADDLGLILAAPQPSRTEHDERPDYYYSLRVIDWLKGQRMLSRTSKIILAGFSGGAKMALIVASFGGDTFLDICTARHIRRAQ